MHPDEYGFVYPQIDSEICILCGACKSVCSYQLEMKVNEPIHVYAAVNRNKEQLLKSSSGGVFSAIASSFLSKGGVVFGATLTFENGHANPHHIMIENIEELVKLQGSKYVQSNIGYSYQKAQEYLKNGRKVLFSGTPCQISGLYGFLRKSYENLTTIDLICHGVPNAEFFDGYIQMEAKKRKASEVIGYSFRDKRKGWGMIGRIDFVDTKEKEHSIFIPARLNSYNTLFLDGYTYRENCYSCKFASPNRVSDISIGDYWGIDTEHPELMNNRDYKYKEGISCLLVNTDKGVRESTNICENLNLNKSKLEKVQKNNEQLSEPSMKLPQRDKLLELYRIHNYSAVEKYYRENFKKEIVVHTLFNILPWGIRHRVQGVVKTILRFIKHDSKNQE